MRLLRTAGVCLVVVCSVGLTATSAAAQPETFATPVAPTLGAKVFGTSAVLRWALAPGARSRLIELSHRPETSYLGGPFLKPIGDVEYLAGPQVAHLVEKLNPGRYYWHVLAERDVPPADPEGDGDTQSAFGQSAFFDVIDTLSVADAKGHIRTILNDDLYSGAAREALIRCRRVNLLRALCRFSIWLGDVYLSGAGPVWYTDDPADKYFHYKIRVRYRNAYCIVERKGRGCRKRWTRSWSG